MDAAQAVTGERARGTDDVLIAGAVCFAAVSVFFRVRGLDIAQSDVASYIAQSRHVLANHAHLPTYAAALFLARAATLGRVPDVALLQLLSFASWCGSVVVVGRLLDRLAPPPIARLGLLLYGLFPFVGITYVAWPISDALAHLALAAGALALTERSRAGVPLALAAMLVVHKALWPFAALFAIVAAVRRVTPAVALAASALPLAAIYAWGARHGDLLWMVRADVALNVAPKTALPVLDGLLGTIVLGGARGVVKAGVLVALFGGTLALAAVHVERRALEMLALVVPVLALFAILNQHEFWAAARFGRVLAIPAAAALADRERALRLATSRAAFGVLVVLLAASQIAFAARLERLFHDGVPAEMR